MEAFSPVPARSVSLPHCRRVRGEKPRLTSIGQGDPDHGISNTPTRCKDLNPVTTAARSPPSGTPTLAPTGTASARLLTSRLTVHFERSSGAWGLRKAR